MISTDTTVKAPSETLIGMTDGQVRHYLVNLYHYRRSRTEYEAAQARLTMEEQHFKTLKAYMAEAKQTAEDGTTFPLENLIDKLGWKLASAEDRCRQYTQQLEYSKSLLGHWADKFADLLLQLKADGFAIDEKLLHELQNTKL